MRVLIAIDSFKGCMRSLEAGRAAEAGILRADPEAQTVVRALADGGEGTMEAMVCSRNGCFRNTTVSGPLGEPRSCRWGMLEDTRTAVIEMAEAAGLALVPEPDRNPLYTTTYGVGELIRQAIEEGCRQFVIGIGGSATNDGGVGMLQALGYDFLDEEGKPIPPGAAGLAGLRSISASRVIPELAQCRFRIACDVTNPLCGPDGCSAVYGPQKGADPDQIVRMDRWLADYARLAAEQFPHADPNRPGAGAAGGLGFAFLTFTNAALESGVQMVLEETRIEDAVKDADLVLTGEGRLDGQTAMGKAPAGIAKLAKQYGKPVAALAGSVKKEASACHEQGIDAYFSILQKPASLEEAMDQETARANMADTAEEVYRLFACARRLSRQ